MVRRIVRWAEGAGVEEVARNFRRWRDGRRAYVFFRVFLRFVFLVGYSVLIQHPSPSKTTVTNFF